MVIRKTAHKVAGRFRIELAMLAGLARGHRRVGGMPTSAEALVLDLPRSDHPLTDNLRRLADICVR